MCNQCRHTQIREPHTCHTETLENRIAELEAENKLLRQEWKTASAQVDELLNTVAELRAEKAAFKGVAEEAAKMLRFAARG